MDWPLINELVKIQPMSVPSGKVFYADLKSVLNLSVFLEECWLEDDNNGEYYCPQVFALENLGIGLWLKLRKELLLFDEWEVREYDDMFKQEEPTTFVTASLSNECWYPNCKLTVKGN
jgi:hypothetical protein